MEYSAKNEAANKYGDRLAEYERYLSITRKEFANLMRISESSVSKYINGTQKLSMETIYYLAESGLNINWLLTGEGEMLNNVMPLHSDKYEILLKRVLLKLRPYSKEAWVQKLIGYIEGSVEDFQILVAEPKEDYVKASAGHIIHQPKDTK